jgi:hypothetical protein
MSADKGRRAGNPDRGQPGADPGDRSSRSPISIDLSKLKEVSLPKYAMRFAFGAVVATVSALVGMRYGIRAGGLLLAFPAILPASLTLIEEQEDTERAVADAKGAILGSIGMLAFGVVVFTTVERLGLLALVLGALAWIGVSLGLYLLVRHTRLFIRA